jgi:hypothetical protein
VNKPSLLKYSKFIKFVPRSPRLVYELVDLLGKEIELQFYAELSPVIITKNTVYHIDKILRKRVRNGCSEVFVKWRRYTDEFKSWIPAKGVKNMASGNEQHTSTSICRVTHHRNFTLQTYLARLNYTWLGL